MRGQPFNLQVRFSGMIGRVAIKNFKSIGDTGVDLELKPLTLLVGLNGAGKSSIMEAIAVASQRSASGTLIQFPETNHMIHNRQGRTAVIEIFFISDGGAPQGGLETTITPNEGLNVEILVRNDSNREIMEQRRTAFMSNTFMVSSTRGTIPYETDVRADARWVGVHGESLLLLLPLIYGRRHFRNVADRITRWGARFGLNELAAGLRGRAAAGSDYLDPELKVVLELALSSSGARQILTIITQLFWSPEGSLLMVEEPEISLHPKAQVDVLEMFAEAIKQDDKQIIATTHSHVLLQALGYAVHKGWLDTKDIAVYHVEKGKTGTKAKLLPLGENGYIKRWVPSYSKVERELLQEWAKTLPRA